MLPINSRKPPATASTVPEIAGIGAGTILRRKSDGTFECVSDEVAIEEPLEIRLGQESIAVTMRTPGHDEELAAGFLLSEGLIRRRADLRELSHCTLPGSFGNILNVSLTAPASPNLNSVHRFGTISTSCGLCGKSSIAAIHQHFPPIAPGALRIAVDRLLELPGLLRRAQGNFDRTGGIHAAAIFDLEERGAMILREDIGRHNAVDKALGRALLDDLLPLKHHILLVSGRSSLEIVQKALSGGIAIVASVSAPSSLAVNFARESGQTLIGFLRPPTFNVYAHVERVC